MAAQLKSLQVLRSLAAFAVICHHAFRAVTVHRPPSMPMPPPLLLGNDALVEIGSGGVDIFFVLSGFIMCYIAAAYGGGARSFVPFMSGRLLRIWPLYALVTAIACLSMLAAAGLDAAALPYDLRALRLASFFFVPSFNEHGLLQPIIGVGWTLNYEMLFYLCFAATLAIGGNWIVPSIVAVIAALYWAGRLLPSPSVGEAFLGNGIIFEFALGVLIGGWLRRGGSSRLHPLFWIGAGILGIVASAVLSYDFEWRAATRGIPAAFLLIGMLGLETRIKWPPLAVALGDASYSTYLVHTQIIFWVSVALFPILHTIVPAIAAELTALTAILAAQTGGWFCHLWIEKPLHARARLGLRSYRCKPVARA